MNKKLLMYLCGAVICLMAACSDNEDEQQKPPEQPKETPEVITEVVETLVEAVPQASDFVEVLKKADLTGVTAEKITVFAVRNELATTRANAGLDTVSVKRHIVVGTYKKEELTDGQELTSVSGDQLLVSKAGDEISINGVVVAGEPVQAGDSYIYVVPKVIPAREPGSSEPMLHRTTFKVGKLTGNDISGEFTPLEGVIVKALNSSKDSLERNITNSAGEVTISHASDTIFYQLYKDGYQTVVDVNGDGKIDEEDQMPEGGLNRVFYTDSENKTVTCYMKEVAEISIALEEAKKMWQAGIRDFYNQNRVLNQKLCYGYDNFSYHDIDSCSSDYWRMAYRTINLGVDLQNRAGEDQSWKEFSYWVQTEMNLIYADVLGFYGQIVVCDAEGNNWTVGTEAENALIASLDKMAQFLPEQWKGAAYAIAARVCLNLKDYQKASDYCKKVIDSGEHELLPNDQVFASQSNKSVVLGGYNDTIPSLRKGAYYHPIRYQEILLMQAEVANKLGKIPEAIAPLNQIMEAEGKTPIAPPDSAPEEIKGYINTLFATYLQKEGLEYSTWRRWGVLDDKIGNKWGYQSSKHSLLPIPMEVLMQYPELRQNPGY